MDCKGAQHRTNGSIWKWGPPIRTDEPCSHGFQQFGVIYHYDSHKLYFIRSPNGIAKFWMVFKIFTTILAINYTIQNLSWLSSALYCWTVTVPMKRPCPNSSRQQQAHRAIKVLGGDLPYKGLPTNPKSWMMLDGLDGLFRSFLMEIHGNSCEMDDDWWYPHDWMETPPMTWHFWMLIIAQVSKFILSIFTRQVRITSWQKNQPYPTIMFFPFLFENMVFDVSKITHQDHDPPRTSKNMVDPNPEKPSSRSPTNISLW